MADMSNSAISRFPSPPTLPDNTSYNPGAAFRVTSGFGSRIDPVSRAVVENHPGVDYVASVNTVVPAVSTGTVIYSGWASGYGGTVIVRSTGLDGVPYDVLYGHVQEQLLPWVGKQVWQGDPIGKIADQRGLVGVFSTGPHLHFELLSGDAPVNPDGGISRSLGWRNLGQYSLDPNSFKDWYGGQPFGGSGTGAPETGSGGQGGWSDAVDENGNFISEDEIVNQSSDVVYSYDTNGSTYVSVSGTDAKVTVDAAAISVDSNGVATITGTGNTLTLGRDVVVLATSDLNTPFAAVQRRRQQSANDDCMQTSLFYLPVAA